MTTDKLIRWLQGKASKTKDKQMKVAYQEVLAYIMTEGKLK